MCFEQPPSHVSAGKTSGGVRAHLTYMALGYTDTDAHVQTCVACVGACLSFLSGLCRDLAHGCLCAAHCFQLCTAPLCLCLQAPAPSPPMMHPLQPPEERSLPAAQSVGSGGCLGDWHSGSGASLYSGSGQDRDHQSNRNVTEKQGLLS